jgi:hypothetical protein
VVISEVLRSQLLIKHHLLKSVKHSRKDVLLLETCLPQRDTEVNKLLTVKLFEVCAEALDETIAHVRRRVACICVDSEKLEELLADLVSFNIALLKLVKCLKDIPSNRMLASLHVTLLML